MFVTYLYRIFFLSLLFSFQDTNDSNFVWINEEPSVLPTAKPCLVSWFSLAVFFQKTAWWAQVDSNHRPHAYQACALTTWAMSPRFKSLRSLKPKVCFANFSVSISLSELLGYLGVSFIYLVPSTFCLLFRTSGGDEEDRTPDPLRARQVLSQLSYTPIFSRVRFMPLFPYSFFEDPIDSNSFESCLNLQN